MTKKYSSLKNEKQLTSKKVYRRKYARIVALEESVQKKEKEKADRKHSQVNSLIILLSQMF